LAAQADGWDPTTTIAGTPKKLNWICQYGHKWLAPVVARKAGNGCPTCGNRKLLVGFNDLQTTHPELAAQADGWDPTTTIAGTPKKLNWICELDHHWHAVVASRAFGGAGCPVCANLKILVGFNDLRTKRPDLAYEAVGWDPMTVISGSASKRRWKCSVGHEWIATVDKRMSGRGCPSCAKSGFDPNKDGYLYFIEHDEWEMLQIGITNSPENRLRSHGYLGWEPLELRGPMDGHLTQSLETDCLHALEKRGAILGHKAGIDKFDGYSEAWTKASLPVTSIKQLLEWVYEDEGMLIEEGKIRP